MPPAKKAAPKAPEADPLESEPTPTGDVVAEVTELLEGDKDEAEDVVAEAAKDPEPELVLIDRPCPTCYPDGWPACEDGVRASCEHLSIVFGQPVSMPREQAEKTWGKQS
jgi:hypothetical protein